MSSGVARIARAQARLEGITAEIVVAKGRELELALPHAFGLDWSIGAVKQKSTDQKVRVAALIADAMIEEARKRGAAS